MLWDQVISLVICWFGFSLCVILRIRILQLSASHMNHVVQFPFLLTQDETKTREGRFLKIITPTRWVWIWGSGTSYNFRFRGRLSFSWRIMKIFPRPLPIQWTHLLSWATTISVCLSVSDCRSCSKNKRYGGILCNEKAGRHTYVSHYPVRFLAAEGNFNLENLLKYFILPPKRSWTAQTAKEPEY